MRFLSRGDGTKGYSKIAGLPIAQTIVSHDAGALKAWLRYRIALYFSAPGSWDMFPSLLGSEVFHELSVYGISKTALWLFLGAC